MTTSEPQQPPRTFSDVVAARLRWIRERRGLSVRQLSARLDVLGYRLDSSAISRAEAVDSTSRRGMTVDDLVALSLALGCSPAALLAGAGLGDDLGEPVQVTSRLAMSRLQVREWVRGDQPVRAPAVDTPQRAYNAEDAPAGSFGGADDYFQFEPPTTARRARLDAARHPTRTTIQRVAQWVDTAVEEEDPANPFLQARGPEDRRALAQHLRRWTVILEDDLRQLADQLETEAPPG